MEEGRFSNKIHWFTFFFSILVIWIHSANAEIYLGRTEKAYFLYRMEDFIGNVVAQIAVPGFFMISSYLFYRNFSMDKLKIKWDSRIKSVLIPFVAWNFLYYIGYVAASRIIGLRDVVGKGIVPFNIMTAGEAVFHYTYNYVFWYLYQLILLILLAPVIYLMVKRKYRAIAAAALLLFAIHKGFRLIHLNLDALLYYGTAAFFAVQEKKAAEGRWNRKRMEAGAAMAGAGVLCLIMSEDGLRVVFVVLFRLLLPLSLWLMVNEEKLPQTKAWMKDTFFLYAVHFAIVRLINKTGAEIFPGIEAVPLILYISMPAICIIVSNGLAVLMKNYCYPFWTLLTGGRNR